MKVGFIGIGKLGWPLAANVGKAGHQVMVYDTDRERRTGFVAEHGGKAAQGLAEIAANDMIVTVLPTGPIVRQVLIEAEGGAFYGAVKPGTVVIDMSSSEPLGTQELGAVLRERGVALIDAPVSKRDVAFNPNAAGATPGASTGALVIMFGGDDKEALARARPLLATMGDTLFETGALGTGHATKTLNNYASAAAHVALAEALLVGERFGLDPARTIDIINLSTGRSFVSEVLFKNCLANKDFTCGFAVGLLAKDVKVAADLAAAMQFDARVARVVLEQWVAARDRLGATEDVAAAYRAWDQDLKK
jgi:3-hydroxyisobutyrate dehydrogenase